MGNWLGGPNQDAIYSQQGIKVEAYVQRGTGVPDVSSGDGWFAFDFY